MIIKVKDFKKIKVKWIYSDVVESLINMIKLGDLECINEKFDFIIVIKKYYNVMEKDGNFKEKGNIFYCVFK